MMRVALFDFDGTLTCRDTTRFLIWELLKLRPWKVLGLFPVLFLAVYLRFRGAVVQDIKNAVLGRLLCDLDDERVRLAVERFSISVQTLYRSDVISHLRGLIEGGYCPLIVTASPDFAISYCLRNLDVQVLGTQFRKVDGRYCGDLDDESCYGEAKIKYINRWVLAQSEEVQFVEAWGDSISDMAMMSLSCVRNWIVSRASVSLFQKADPGSKFYIV